MNKLLKTLTLVCLLLTAATTAFAAEITVNTGVYADLQTAVGAADGITRFANDIVKLGADFTGNTELTIGRDLTLDLNGKNLTIDLPTATGNSSNGIKISSGVTLTIIDGNPSGSNALTVTNGSDIFVGSGYGAAINVTEGTLIITSGKIIATGGSYGASIGGGNNGEGGNIIINGGIVEATGSIRGAGIGGGNNGSGGNITITGGTVEATTASGSYGACIGGGSSSSGGIITITNGYITAISGGTGAGIGGGLASDGGNITIADGVVNATGSNGSAGIGGGFRGAGGTIIITGGIIAATGANSVNSNNGSGAGIGGGGAVGSDPSGASGSITITGNTAIIAQGGASTWRGGGAGIGSGGSGSGGAVGAAGDAANPIIIEGTVITSGTPTVGQVLATGGTGNSGRNGANIGYGGGLTSAGAELTAGTAGNGTNYGTSVTRHIINATAGAGGSISPSGAVSVVEHANQVFTVTANAGYAIVSVTGQTISNNRQLTFVIPNVTASQTINASFAAKTLSVGTQTGTTPTYGTAGSASFSVTAANISDGLYTATLGGTLPAGVTVGNSGNVAINVNSGTFTLNTTAATPAGTHTFTITIDGVTANVTLTVNKATSNFGTPAAINTTYTPTLTLADLTLPSGYAWDMPATAITAAGTGQTFPATFTDPSGNYEAASGTITVNVAKANTTTALSSALNPSVYGQSVMFTATVTAVSPGGGTPAGNVEFREGSTVLGTGTLDDSGIATFTISALSAEEHFIVAFYMGNGNYTHSNSVVLFQDVICPANFKDHEDNDIIVARLAGMCWTSNMKNKTYEDGTPIPFARAYQDKEENAEIFGLLYDWQSAIRTLKSPYTQGVCPEGWHIPTQEEFLKLSSYSATQLKSANYWINTSGTDDFGFSSLPAGMHNSATLRFVEIYGTTGYWSCGLVSPSQANSFLLNYYCEYIQDILTSVSEGLSVRCVKD